MNRKREFGIKAVEGLTIIGLAVALILLVLCAVSLSGCFDMSSDNTNYNGEYPKAGTATFIEIDTNHDGVISDEEWAHWITNQP